MSMQHLVEYYDELFPVSAEQLSFYKQILARYRNPVKVLNIGCGTGSFEHKLARLGHDVTGLEVWKELLDSAARRRRLPMTAVRFFNMSTVEMGSFLGKKFYNIISCLNGRIVFIHDKALMRKFFCDCKILLAEQGTLVLQLPNFSLFPGRTEELPCLKSIRASLGTKMERTDSETLVSQQLTTCSGKRVHLIEKAQIYPITAQEITENAQAAGFSNIAVYSGFDCGAAQKTSPFLTFEIY